MGMSSSVAGIVPADDTFNDMKAIWEMCERTNVPIPDKVLDFFNGETPDDAGVVVYIDSGRSPAVTDFANDYQQGYEVDISKLDPKYKILRFVNSW
jgi:hypothetical protein